MKKEIDDTTVKDIRNFFRLKKENEAIKDRINRGIRNLFEHEEEYYYKTVRVGNAWSYIYTEYENKGNRNKTLSIDKYLNKIRSYIKNIINDLNKSDAGKI